jgi:hypothetical protein
MKLLLVNDMKKYFLLAMIALTSGMSSCTEVLDVELDPEDGKVVVEGLVTDQLRPFRVKLSRTISFSQEGLPPAIDNATVSIADDQGNTFPLFLESNGVYKTAGAEQGIVGRNYTLTVTVDGSTYTATDKLLAVPPIDTIYSIYRTIDATRFEEGYYAYASSTDPANEENYYLYKFYRNNTPVGEPSDVYINDDRFLSSNIAAVELPGTYVVGDLVKMEIYSLTRKSYLFYFGLASLLNNDGGFFSTPPANAPGNIEGGALGLFQASGLTSDSVLVAP